MDNSEAFEECIVKAESGDSKSLPVKVNIEHVKQETDSEEEIAPPAQVMVGTVKEEITSDEEELEPPAKVTVEDFKEDISEGFYASVLPVGSAVPTSVSLSRPQTSLQLQWKEEDGQSHLPAHISSNAENWVENKGCVTITTPNAGSSWISADGQSFSEGTLIKDGNVQYVLMTSADSFYVVENAENNAMCASDGSIKNLISGDKNIQLISIVPNQNATSGNVVIGGLAREEPESGEKTEIPTSSSNKRSSEQVIAFSDIQSGVCNMHTPQTTKKKKTEDQNIVHLEVGGDEDEDGDEEANFIRSCDVKSCAMRCSSVFDESERREIYRAFDSLPFEEQKKFVLQSCTRKIFLKDVKTSDGTIKTTSHQKYDFQLKSSKGIPVHVCKSFFASTLGFTNFTFRCYLNDLYKKSSANVVCPAKNPAVPRCTCSGTTNQKTRGNRVKWFGSCKLHSDVYCHVHKERFHNHIESFLRTVCIPQGEVVRTVRYLPKDVSIEMMHQDFCQKHPQVNSPYELYKSFVIHFTS